MLDIDLLIKESMKAHNTVETKVYRALKAEILNYKTAKNAKPYDESSEINLIKKMIKSHEDSILMYSEAGRKDLVTEEEDELDVLSELIPAPPSLSSVRDFFENWIQTGNVSEFSENKKIPKSFKGVAIKTLKAQFPAADGKTLANLVDEYVVH